MNKNLIIQLGIVLLFINGLSSCSSYKTLVRETKIYEECDKADIMKKNLQPGDEITLNANGIIYENYMVALLRPDEMTVVRTNPILGENNYFSFLYEDIDAVAVKYPPFDDEIGLSTTLLLIVLYIII